MAKSYYEKLKDPRWQKRRLQVLEAAEWGCQRCGSEEETLHVHHKAYFKGREPWEYDDDQLAVLCESCHESLHDADFLMDAVSRIPMEGPNSRDFFAALIAGALHLDFPLDMPFEKEAYAMGSNLEREFSARLRKIVGKR